MVLGVCNQVDSRIEIVHQLLGEAVPSSDVVADLPPVCSLKVVAHHRERQLALLEASRRSPAPCVDALEGHRFNIGGNGVRLGPAVVAGGVLVAVVPADVPAEAGLGAEESWAGAAVRPTERLLERVLT